jgi:hypothetical protein
LTDNGLIGQLVANDTKVSRDSLIQLFAFARQAWSAAGMNTKEPESADEHCLSELESSMSIVQIGQKSYKMPPREGMSIAHFLTVADIERLISKRRTK